MNYMVLPTVRRVSDLHRYPYSRAKVKVGEDWYVILSNTSHVMMAPYLFREDIRPNLGHQVTAHIAYRCSGCNTTFMAYDLTGYIHKCCEVE